MSIHNIEDRYTCKSWVQKLDPPLHTRWIHPLQKVGISSSQKNTDPPLWYTEAGSISHTDTESTPHLVLGLLVIHDQLKSLEVSVKGPSPKLQFCAAVLRLIQGHLQGLSVLVIAHLIGLQLGNLLLFSKNRILLWYPSWIDAVLYFQCVSEYKSIAFGGPILITFDWVYTAFCVCVC